MRRCHHGIVTMRGRSSTCGVDKRLKARARLPRNFSTYWRAQASAQNYPVIPWSHQRACP